MKRLFLAAAAAATLATPALGQDAPPPPPPPGSIQADSITVGLGVGLLPSYEGSDDSSFTPVPGAVGFVSGHAFLLAGNRLSVDLIRNQAGPGWDLQAGPLGVLNLNRRTRGGIKDDRVAALGTRGVAVELGGYAGIARVGVITSDYDRLSVTVSYRRDIAGVHSAGVLQPTVNYVTPLSTRAAVGLFATAERAERGYARTYFSVLPGQVAASGLPAFNARGGWKNYSIGALGTVALTGDLFKGWKLVAGGSYGRLLNDFGDSPVVAIAGSRTQWLGALGLGYTF